MTQSSWDSLTSPISALTDIWLLTNFQQESKKCWFFKQLNFDNAQHKEQQTFVVLLKINWTKKTEK